MKKKTPKQVHNSMYVKEILKITAKFSDLEATDFLIELVELVEKQHKKLLIKMSIDCEV